MISLPIKIQSVYSRSPRIKMSSTGLDQLFSVHARKASDLYGKFATYAFMSRLYASKYAGAPSASDVEAVKSAIENYLAVLVAAKMQWKQLKSESIAAAQNPALSLAKVLSDNAEAFVAAKTNLRKTVAAFREKYPNDIWFHEIESTVSDLNRESDIVLQALRDLKRPCACACTFPQRGPEVSQDIVEVQEQGQVPEVVEEVVAVEKPLTRARTLSTSRPTSIVESEVLATAPVTAPALSAAERSAQRRSRIEQLSRALSSASATASP